MPDERCPVSILDHPLYLPNLFAYRSVTPKKQIMTTCVLTADLPYTKISMSDYHHPNTLESVFGGF
jgi:hypothetical protein